MLQTKGTVMSENIIYTGRKSFVAYISLIIGRIIFIGVFNGVLYGVSWGMGEADASETAFRYLSWAWKGINVYLVFRAIYSLFYIRTLQWIITDEGVRIKAGILPWRQTNIFHPYETIFEAYYEFGFFAKLLKYGECSIRRTEGITTAISEIRMHNAAKITGLINEKLKLLRKETKGQAFAPAAKTDTEELAHLGQLKADGTISAEEFETMKRKIIER